MRRGLVRSMVLLPMLASAITPGMARGQSLPDSLIQRIRAGAAHVVVPGDSVVLPLVGTPRLPLIEVRVNGTGPYRFLIDLGSNVTLLRRDVVDRSGSTVLVDRTTSDIVHVATLRLGSARLEDVTAGSYDELDVDGVLGYNVLQYVSFTLDFPGQRLVLHHRSLPPPDGENVIAYRLHERMPVVMVGLGGDSLVVYLDTGASEWMTVPPRVEAGLRWLTPPTPGPSVYNNQTGRTQVRAGRLADTLTLGVFRVASPLVYVNTSADDPWIGAAAMNRAAWTFDPAHQRLEITMLSGEHE